MPTERTTVLASVNLEDDEEARYRKIEAQVGEGWRVVSTIPLSGGDMGPGGASEDFLRMQVILEREIDGDNVIVTDDAADEEE